MSAGKSLLGMFVALSVAGQASAATLSLTDSTFAGWSIEAIVGSPGFQTGSQQPDGGNTGGNPDPFWQVTTTTNELVYSMSSGPGLEVDPSVSGAILSMDVSFDFRPISAFGQGHAFGLALQQGGQYFYAITGISGSQSTDWQNESQAGLVAANFVAPNGGTLDFSESGGPIRVGLLTANQTGAGITIGYDNFAVTVNLADPPDRVPEPALGVLFALAGLSAAGVGALRRRQQG